MMTVLPTGSAPARIRLASKPEGELKRGLWVRPYKIQ